MNAHEQLDQIITHGDPLLLATAIEWGLSDPNLRAEIGRSLDLLIASKGYCQGEANQAADGILAVVRGYLENRGRRAAA